MASWKLPLIVAALTVPIVAAFRIGGAAAGVAIGALAVLVLLVVAAQLKPEDPIVSAPAHDDRPHLLVVVTRPVEDPATIGAIARETGDSQAEVLVLAPAKIGFLDRWTSDVEGARHAAQQSLVVTVAALAKAGVAAEARVGDENVLQAVEDQLHSYPATKVVVVSGDGEGDADRALTALEARLEADLTHIVA
jgi:peptide subunit release factor 1 (eRF1)